MIQESSECSFARPEGCSGKEAIRIIKNLKARNLIPDLRDCRVFVNGGPGKSSLQVENIRNFSIRYLKETQAELSAYEVDAGNQITSFLSHRRAQIK